MMVIGIIVEVISIVLIIFFPNIIFVSRRFYPITILPVNSQNIQNLVAVQSVESLQSTSTPERVGPGLPTLLKIPEINVNSLIEHVGLVNGKAMGVPEKQENVAWFTSSQRPGENGNAVIAGHYGWKNKRSSAFDNLYKLRKGDRIFVEDEFAETTTFIVREIRRYSPDADATAVFSSDDGNSHLNLITCEGNWEEDSKSYSRRLVVFADRE